MKQWLMVLGMFAFVVTLALGSMPTAHADGGAGKCGDEGQPDCPMQGWMRKNMDEPQEKGDLKAIAAAYEKLASMAPDPSWNTGDTSWQKISKDGAEAAAKGDQAAAKKLCKTCHKAWRDKYKTNFRMKPVK